MTTPTTRQWLASLLEPGQILSMAVKSYLIVCLEAILEGRILAPLLETPRLRDEAFGRFWVAFSGTLPSFPTFLMFTVLSIRIAPPQSTQPTTNEEQGQQQQQQQQQQQHQQHQQHQQQPTQDQPAEPAQIQGSADLIPPLLATARGITLDLGPGTGTQMPHLRSPAITALYGVEPCHHLHATLRARAEAEGVSERYTILGCSAAPDQLVPVLQQRGLVAAVDTILCVRVLCSVPDLAGTVRGLYSLLKPGGRVIVVEHVVNSGLHGTGSVVARVVQGLYELLGWRWFVGDCCLTRDTEGALRGAAAEDGGWERVELRRYFGEGVMPYVAGVLVKKGEKEGESGGTVDEGLRRR
ncbi:S-adenosyl-L-methionine-dependent methyltransferase [Aspergillus indologenus CBS 114.80]|uniref:S-adenosyl-L-methionine-dependent methyltransferase n=1 Tax=Aspergillus indologenus CBS 114.80 TaxID=1450541 RepID=A0A2V5I4F0_9EURO|nr:S-adenosyl-L-methionine-dependent methyltransferase [Aspergillus indologenus CBS 114.80]